MTMGTASTMACMVEVLGLALSDNGAIPAVDARRYALAQQTGRRIVGMIRENLRMSQVLTRAAFENAVRMTAAIGGSTNAVIHLLALAGRIGVPFQLRDWDRLGAGVPCIVDLQPAGRHLMEDFYYAGGVPAVLRELLEAGLLNHEAITVNGKTIRENVVSADNWNCEVIRSITNPLKDGGGVAVLSGNLAPDGAIIKPATADPRLLRHRGRAVVFESIEHFNDRIDDASLDIDENSIMVLKNCGPRGYPGMPEVGNMRLPRKLLRRGIKDIVRISDARMSGTAYGTVVLHVAPEAATGGPLALVNEGDVIALDVANRSLVLELDEPTLARRRSQWRPPGKPARGYVRLYVEHVMQADQGADFDFLAGSSGAAVSRESH